MSIPIPPDDLRRQWINESPILQYWSFINSHARVGTDWQAVIEKAAAWGASQAEQAHLAAFRAQVDALLPEEPPPHRGMRPGGSILTYQETLSVERQRLRAVFLAVVAELEGVK